MVQLNILNVVRSSSYKPHSIITRSASSWSTQSNNTEHAHLILSDRLSPITRQLMQLLDGACSTVRKILLDIEPHDLEPMRNLRGRGQLAKVL